MVIHAATSHPFGTPLPAGSGQVRVVGKKHRIRGLNELSAEDRVFGVQRLAQ
jgi:hypothetical protein